MNILHLFSGNLFNGAVEHALELAGAQMEAGHRVLLASDFAGVPTTLPHFTVPVHDRRWAQKRRARKRLRLIIREQEVQIIHAHSKAAAVLARSVIRGREPALVSTVHDRQHVHFKSKRTDPYGEKIIAVNTALKVHLVEELNKKESKIAVISSGLHFPSASLVALPAEPVISWIGKLSGGKGARAAVLFKSVFPALLHAFPQLRIVVAGDAAGPMPEDGDDHLACLREAFGERVQDLGFIEDIGPTIEASSLVIGAGRIALRALGLGRQVLALGEASCEGLVTIENIEALAAGNFGDTGEREEEIAQKAAAALQIFLNAFPYVDHRRPAPALAAWVREHYNIGMIRRQVEAVYREARMRRLQPQWFPVLLYQKVPDGPLDTSHPTCVEAENFEKHLKWMRGRGLVPVTFEDYEAVAAGERRAVQWPQKPVILTFDGGYESVWRNAFPKMQALGWRGVLYLLGTDLIHFNNWEEEGATTREGHLMNRAQVAGLLRAGWQCGAHTLTHPKLSTLSTADLRRQIKESKTYLEQTFGYPVETFAYPFGDYNDGVVGEVWAAGFCNAVATDRGGPRLEDDRFRIFRVPVEGEEGAFSFWKKTSFWYRRYYFWKKGT